MTLLSSSAMLAPFRVRSFRFQWPADLLTSWGIEMENLVLGWYILVETGSVLALTLFWALQYLGTLLAPVFGMAGDRIGHRTILCAMRAAYALVAAAVTGLAYAGALMATMGVSRTTADSARIAGSLFGAGLFALFGMGPVYLAITGFYMLGFLLTLGVAGRRHTIDAALIGRPSLWRDLIEGLGYVWDTPRSLAAMWLAFLVNLTAFPLTSGLLPYVAKDIYGLDQTGLGTLVASSALGSLLGSVAVSLAGRAIRPGRMMILFALAWYMALLVFVEMQGPAGGRLTLILAGFMQSLSLVPMSVMLLNSAGERFRGRVMGVRMLAIYGVPIGLLIAGVLIEWVGFAWTASLYCAVGLVLTGSIALYWRADLWPREAPANWR